VTEALEPYLPYLWVDAGRTWKRSFWTGKRPSSIGRVKGFYGNMGVLIRAYALHPQSGRTGPWPELQKTRAHPITCGCACVTSTRCRTTGRACTNSSCRPQAQAKKGGTAKAIGKRILDYGMQRAHGVLPLSSRRRS